jgi:hypothetical protein
MASSLTPIAHQRFVSSGQRHYELMEQRPNGFLAIGDALCHFNPIYAQGMSAAAIQVEMWRDGRRLNISVAASFVWRCLSGSTMTLRFHIPLIGRVEDWRAGLGRCSCSLLSRPFVCECHSISAMPRFQSPPRRTQRADFPLYALLFASPQGLWDLSCRGDFRP